MIITQTPLRISFFGGGTDQREFCSPAAGAVLSTTIDTPGGSSLRSPLHLSAPAARDYSRTVARQIADGLSPNRIR